MSRRGRENEVDKDFQNRQVRSLLELREAQADVEAERRLEHLRQVSRPRGLWDRPASWTDLPLAGSSVASLRPQAQQRLREVVLDAHATQFKRLKEINER